MRRALAGRKAVRPDATLAVGNRNRKARTLHSLEEDGRRLFDLDRGVASLELLGNIAHEPGPRLCSGNYVLELREHLAAVADAEGESIGTREEL